MKFEIVKKNGLPECLERLGQLYLGNNKITTPSCTIYMPAGCVPYVTNDLFFKHVPHLPQIAEIPFSTLIENRESLIQMKKPLNHLMGTKSLSTYLTIHDSLSNKKLGYNEAKKIAVWSKKGKTLLGEEEYARFLNESQFDLAECLYDFQISVTFESKKQVRKAYDRTKHFVDTLFAKEPKLVQNENVQLVLPLISRDKNHLDLAKLYVEHLTESQYSYSSVVLHGVELDKNSSQESSDLTDYEETIRFFQTEVLKGSNTLITFPHCIRPDRVIKAVELGVDLFNGSYPAVMTQSNQALMFDYLYDHQVDSKKRTHESDEEDVTVKKRKNSTNGGTTSVTKEKNDQNRLTINLGDKIHAEEFKPLKAGCQCYTCSNFTRSYIHHLVNVKELSSHTLLMIHNLTTYYNFFEQIRESIRLGYFSEYKEFILNQFKE